MFLNVLVTTLFFSSINVFSQVPANSTIVKSLDGKEFIVENQYLVEFNSNQPENFVVEVNKGKRKILRYEVAKQDILDATNNSLILSHNDAIQACKNYYENDGKRNWFLPDKDLLKSIYLSIHQNKLESLFNSFVEEQFYWTSSLSEKRPAEQKKLFWAQNMSNSHQNSYYDSVKLYVRCVRAL